MSTTVMLPPPVAEGYPVRCPGTDGRESHVFYLRTKPNPRTTYYCPKCHPFLYLDRIAREISAGLSKEEDKPIPQSPILPIKKSIDQLLDEIT